MSAIQPSVYRVRAFNTATSSENRIHDDAVARRLGFRGGLVPGVDVYAYMTHPVVEQWGRAWLEHGAMDVRFLQPVYDGEETEVRCEPATGATELKVTVHNPAGAVCATGQARLPEQAARAPRPEEVPPAPLPSPPPDASPDTLAPGCLLGAVELGFHAAMASDYLAEVRETQPLYEQEGLAHPGYLLRCANWVLATNVRLGPWIHAASQVQHHDCVTGDVQLSTRARVMREYEKKGHRFVDLDVLVVADDSRVVLRARHTAIYQPRGMTSAKADTSESSV